MNIVSKALAQIEPGADDAEQPNGSFHVILSAESKDRDGDVLRAEEWQQPLPGWINFDIDHAMSVEKTIGSGVPTIEDDGCMHMRGTYSSLPLAQDVRTLVNEGHVRNTSVTFMTTKEKKDGATVISRELLNGAFVSVPSNRDTVVLASKGLDVEAKAGARNNAADAKTIQSIHDATASLGATCSTADAETADTGEMDGANKGVDVAALVKAEVEAAVGKAAAPETADAGPDMAHVCTLAKAVDAALDEAMDNARQVDTDALQSTPPRLRQALDLMKAAAVSAGQLLQVLGADDPDHDAPTEGGDDAEAKSVDAADTEMKAAVSDKPWSDFAAADYSLEQYRAACLIAPAEPSENKDDYKLPVREPNGTLNRNGVHAAASVLAGGRGGVDAPADAKAQAAKTLVGLYRSQLKEDPPDSLLELAGESPKDDAKSADPAAAASKAAAAVSADEDLAVRARALRLMLAQQERVLSL